MYAHDPVVPLHSRTESYVGVDNRRYTRLQQFWCCTTAEPSSVILVRRRVRDYDDDFPNRQARPTTAHEGYQPGDSWATCFVGNCTLVDEVEERRSAEAEQKAAMQHPPHPTSPSH
jgi:hypothetical protein